MQWSALSLVAILGVSTAGCGEGVFCGKCGPPKPPPTEIVWDGLAEELKEVDFDIDMTVNVESATVAVDPGEDGLKIQVTNWQKLVSELRKTETWRAKQVEHYALMHRLHAMLARQKPPVTQNYWLLGSSGSTPVPAQCPADLSVFVVFSREAQFEDWKKGNYYDGCPPVKCPEEPDRSCEEIVAPVCPNRTMYEEQIGSYLANLEKCESGQRTLRVRGFASSSGISRKLDAGEFQKMQGDFERLAACDKVAIDPLRADTQMFNLLVSSIRAHNVAELLRTMGGDRGITIEEEPWCSYEKMRSEPPRILDNRGGAYDSVAGMWNRRAQIRVAR